MNKLLAKLTNAFALWVLFASLAALFYPSLFTWFSGPLIPFGLGMIMLGMGLTLSLEDFKSIFKFPTWVLTGIFFQYAVMPFLGWSLGYLFKLPTHFAVGLVLVACCPGGTASNVVAYLARANVALSVTMTMCSTFMAVLMTPFLTSILVGSRVEVDAAGLLMSTFQVVVLPIISGIVLNRFLPKVTQKILPVAPLTAVIFITLIVASIVGAQRDEILRSGFALIGAIFLLHAGGFLLGYSMSRILFKKELIARTIAIEVGMQNSGLGVFLARAHFANPAVAIPSAISSVFHSLIGSICAAFWRKKTESQEVS